MEARSQGEILAQVLDKRAAKMGRNRWILGVLGRDCLAGGWPSSHLNVSSAPFLSWSVFPQTLSPGSSNHPMMGTLEKQEPGTRPKGLLPFEFAWSTHCPGATDLLIDFEKEVYNKT